MVEFESFVLAILFGSISCSYVRVWRRTKIKEKFLFGQFSSMIVKSVNKCAEECSCSFGCKSFGFNIDSFNCSLYEDFAYSGSNFIPAINQVYYWEVLGNCSVTQGYQLDVTGTVCYKVYSENRNWTDAQQRCEQDGGHLFISDTMNRYSIVQNALPGSKIYVGSTDLVEEGVWNWLNGVPFPRNSSMWTDKQPNNWNGTQHCLALDGNFSDIFCKSQHPFICEIPFKIS